MAQNQIDLFSMFNQVTKAMQESKQSLNDADTYNHDHGDHMVEIFEVITQAMKEKKQIKKTGRGQMAGNDDCPH